MKKIFSFVFIVLYFMFITSFVAAEEIRNFDSKITLNKDGTITVSETIDYDFGALDKHGIYRTIPYIKTNKEGKKFRLDFYNISVKNETGNAYQYSRLTEGDKLKLKIGNPNRTISGIHTYIIDYQVSGALTYFSDHDELYWNITGNDWTVPINNAAVTVSLPQEIQQKDIQAVCYTGYAGSTSMDCSINQKGNSINSSALNLSASQGLTVSVKFPINIVARLEPKELISFWQTFIGKLTIGLIILLAFFWYLIYPIMIIYKWWKYGRDPQGQVKEVRAWYDAPKTKNGREMTPSEVGGLIDEVVQIRDVSAATVDLARRGYLKIEERKKNDFWLVRRPVPRSPKDEVGSLDEGGFIKTKKPTRDLLTFEKKLIDGIFIEGETVRLKDQELALTVQDIQNELYTQLVSDGLFPKNPNTIRTFYTVIGIMAFVTLNLPLALIAFTFGRAMPAKTIFGVESANIAKSLKNFLTSQQRQLEFQADKQYMFEKLLPYAVAFGVERIWAERFKDMALKQPEWYSSYSSTGMFNSMVFASSLHSSMSSFRSAATPTTSSSGFSSGFSGGSSGGGGGGGGGGSW